MITVNDTEIRIDDKEQVQTALDGLARAARTQPRFYGCIEGARLNMASSKQQDGTVCLSMGFLDPLDEIIESSASFGLKESIGQDAYAILKEIYDKSF